MNSLLHISLLLCIILGILISAVLLIISYLITIHNPDPEKVSAYECGFEPFEDARNKFDVRFYIVAILFLIFDIEIAFLFPWSVTFALTGFAALVIVWAFLLLLTLGFIYEVIKGALNPH